jgi:ElaB/YqjD/DUF883 family membrane-anchored ribosome-binding protein
MKLRRAWSSAWLPEKRAAGPARRESKTQAFERKIPMDQKTQVTSEVNRGKEAIGDAASEAMETGRAELTALQRDISDLKETMTKFIDRSGNEAARSARAVAGQVGAAASDNAQRGANVASVATDQAKTFASELENMARRNPIGTLAGVLAVGVLIGMMGRRS